ncbi:CNBP [Mytilus coruscus]|uniref:CNBP n=1 Tax=Mytilus coruscus TaxID=42192 RepID=A0A6J8AW19_MYTCO|nr:CNBP [Mytilus coruscus]
MLNKENPSIRIIVGGLLPREGVDMMNHNQCLMDLCGEMEIDFINHVDSYVLRNGRLIPGVLYPDCVHLTKKGTSILIRNMNDVTPILANTYSENGRDKSDLNFGFQNHFQQRYSTNRNLYSQRATHEVHSKFESQSRQQNSPKSCFNCGETNHSQVSCRFKQRIRCYSCHKVGHKQKLCRKQYFTDTQGYRQPNGHVPFNYMYEN